MNEPEIRKLVVEELGNIAPEADPESIGAGADLREALDIDSIDFLNFVTALTHRLGIDIPEIDYPKLGTLDRATAYLAAKVGAK
jgi:acyl carrier protein